jgi:hypothetical protein
MRSIKSLVASDCSTKNESVNVAGAFVGIDSFQIGSVANHVVFVADAIAAKHVSGVSCDVQRLGTVVSLYYTDHLWGKLVSILQ